jgi:hypothetical protein
VELLDCRVLAGPSEADLALVEGLLEALEAACIWALVEGHLEAWVLVVRLGALVWEEVLD